MKKLILICCGAFLASCKTPTGTFGDTTLSTNGQTVCIQKPFYVDIPEDSLKLILSKGVVVGSNEANAKITYSGGKLSVEPYICIPLKK